MKSFLAIILVAMTVSAHSEQGDYLEQEKMKLENPMYNPNLFQGDIMGFDPHDRNVLPGNQRRWRKGIVPFVVHSSLRGISKLIRSAMLEYSTKTCIRFMPKLHQDNYILLHKGEGCSSYVGMIGGRQNVSLGDGCEYKGTILHELGHAIGFFHEQNRSDRDKYLVIYWDNISQGNEDQFLKMPPHMNILYTPIDYESIMLYGNFAFSKDGRSVTIAARDGTRLLDAYEKDKLSESDIYRIKKMYDCRNLDHVKI